MIQLKRILSPTDFSEASLVALPYAVELAKLFDAELFVIHVVHTLPPLPADFGYGAEVVEFSSALREEAAKELDRVVEPYASMVKITKLLHQGQDAETILRAIGQNKIDLVVIATHGRTGWRHLVFGSVAEKVVRLAQVPVLSVRAQPVGGVSTGTELLQASA